MTLLPLCIGCGLAALILTRIISSVTERRRCQAEAVRLGCKPAPVIPKKGLFGLTRFLDYLKAMRDERSPQQFVMAMNELGTTGEVHTARLEGNLGPLC